MSKVFKSIGKIFKKVVKVVKKIAIPALIIGAIVLTGGAALGALPAMGAMLGSVGISGTLASVLGGAISMGAVGAVTGGIGGLMTGQGLLKGATKGFLMGAATGGVMGGLGVIGANGILGGMGGATTTAAAGGLSPGLQNAGQTALGGMAPDLAALSNFAAPATTAFGGAAGAAGAAATGLGGAAAAAAPAAASSGGLLGQLGPSLLQVGGSVLSGFASGKAAQAEMEAKQEEDRAKYDRIAYNYGYKNLYDGKDDNVPSGTSQWYNYAPQNFAAPDPGLLRSAFQAPPPTPSYQIVNGQVVMAGA